MSVPPAVSPSNPPTEPTPTHSRASDEIRALLEKGRTLLDLDGGHRPDALAPAIVALLGQLDLDRLDAATTRDTCDQEEPVVDHDLIRIHTLTVRAIFEGVEEGMLHPDLTEILNTVIDVLESCRMYRFASGRWVRDAETIQMWREMRARHDAGLPLLPPEALAGGRS
jgi:hypothetical protein